MVPRVDVFMLPVSSTGEEAAKQRIGRAVEKLAAFVRRKQKP